LFGVTTALCGVYLVNEQEKKLRERAMLDAMEDDEVEYYGSDHEERAKGKGESLEDALDRVVAETEVTCAY
jgi:type IV secretory pathway VirD2 relaxase